MRNGKHDEYHGDEFADPAFLDSQFPEQGYETESVLHCLKYQEMKVLRDPITI